MARLPDLVLRTYRALARPLGRWGVRRRDRRRLAAALAADPVGPGQQPAFVIVVPRTFGWLEPCLKLVPNDQPLWLITNGLSRDERRQLREAFPNRPQFALSVPPRSYAKHGTVIDLLVAGCPHDFVVLDHDCYVFDRSLFDPIDWRDGEFIAGVDEPGFFTVNAATGLRFPRTHFLVLRRQLLWELRERYGVGCEKALRTPTAVRDLLATIGIGDSNLPPARMRFYDTLQLAMSVGFALGWAARTLETTPESIAHIGGTGRVANQPGLKVPGAR